MTFEAAEKKLKKIANGGYRLIGYELTIASDGARTPVCSLYVHNYNWHKGRTWKESFKSLDVEINGHHLLDTNEAPKGNDDE